MLTFEQLHPDITELYSYDTLKHWEYRDIHGNIQEAWDRREDGTWVNTTLLHQEIQRAQREEAKMARMEAKNDESTN